ncbi:MAG: aldehyde dehydrogenase family protein [Caulobacteraceae bacterium]|nr:aldehyde dehydrogenase family protein [Caulobacteraceae bacterium]
MAGNTATVAGVEVSTDHWIDGRRVSSADRFDNLSPVDGSHLAQVASGGQAEAELAVDAARRAFPAWAALGPEGRLPYLKRFAEGLRERAKDLAAVETMDNGSLLAGNLHRVIPRAAQNIAFFADWALTLQDHVIDSPEVVNHVRYDPAGVAALVTPWNAPLMLTTWKVGPALAAGNTVVVKPPEWAPLTCSLMADIAHAAGIPAGVLNVLQGIGGGMLTPVGISMLFRAFPPAERAKASTYIMIPTLLAPARVNATSAAPHARPMRCRKGITTACTPAAW